VAKVIYPGLRSHPQHDLAQRRLVAPFGGRMRLASGRAFYLITPRLARTRPEVSAFRDWLLAESRAAVSWA